MYIKCIECHGETWGGQKSKSQGLEDGLEARGLSEGTSSTVCKDEGHRDIEKGGPSHKS